MAAEKLGGLQAAVDSLKGLAKEDRVRILAEIALKDPSLAEQIKKHLFQFEDIVSLRAEDFRKLQQAVDKKKFCLALRKVSDDFKVELKKLMSERANEMLWDEVEALGPQRLSEVEAAQQEVIDLLQDLAKKGIVSLPNKWSNEEYV